MRPPLRSSLLGLAGLGALFWSAAPAAADPSFDCLKAGNAIERLICADSDLARRDSQMARIYLGALEVVDEAQAVKERATQRAWLAERNSACALTAAEEAVPARAEAAGRCLRNLYEKRVRDLQTAYPEPLGIDRGPYVSGGDERREVCLRFDAQVRPDPLQPLESFFKVEPEIRLTARADWREACLAGFEPGKKYKISVLEGLPGEGAPLARGASFDFVMPDLPSALRFATVGRMLPRYESGGLPVEGVNVREVSARLMRVDDADALAALRSEWEGGPDVFAWGAPDYFISRVDAVVWRGTLALEGERNQTRRVALPIDRMVETEALKPGVYVAILEGKPKFWPQEKVAAPAPAEGEDGEAEEVQDEYEEPPAESVGPVFYWFTVSDIGLTTWQGDDGLTVMTRSIEGQQPLSGIRLALHGAKGALLGEATADEAGVAKFPSGLLRGEGPRAPARLYAYGADGEFTQLDLTRAPLDLSDRGVAGRVAPGALDAYLTTERGVYRPGESVEILALLRDDHAAAVDDFPLTIVYRRPDGVEARRETLTLAEAGGATTRLNLPPNAAIGYWSAEAYASAEAKTAIGSVSFMVEDFAPPRIEAKLTSEEKSVGLDAEALLKVQADFLYGAPAGGLTGELVTTLRAPATPFADFADYRFGLADEQRPRPEQSEAESFALDETGGLELMAYVAEPENGVGGYPMEAEFAASVFDAGGKPVTARFTLPVRTHDSFVGAKPSFAGSTAPLDGTVGFELVAVSPEGEAVPAEASWRIVREYVDYIWHQRGDRWRTEIIRTDGPVLAEGSATLGAEPAAISAKPQGWGSYRLEVRLADQEAPSLALRFDAGWASSDPGSEPAPERVQVSIEPGAYKPGATARLRVTAPFDGQAAVALAGDRIYSVSNHEVSAEGSFIDVTMPEEATAGVYALVSAFGAPDGVMRQVPTRAVGVVWIPADPASRSLEAKVSLNEVIQPTEPATVTLEVADPGPEAGPLYGVVFAVDDGVLQLTGYAAPDPANYYLGQRRLGLSMRDGYGQLIDAAGLEIGEIRTGGDGEMAALDSAQMGALPKKNRPIAVWVSDIRELTPGVNEIPFDAPDFDGRLRVMAVVWTSEQISSAAESTVLVRRPLAADAMIPRFLAPGDEAEATVALHNLDGAPGVYTATLLAEGPLEILGETVVEAELAQGQRAERVIRVKAREDMGDGKLTLSVAGPQGFGMSRESALSVRPSSTYESRRIVSTLKPGESLIADPSLIEGYFPATARLSMGVNPLPDLDLPGIIDGLARYPYGCAEQTASTLAPLIASADLRPYFKMDLPRLAREADEGIAKGVARLAAMQNWRGDFGMWSSAGSTNSWLTAYIMDTLLVARSQGREVPEQVLEQGVRRLADLASSTGGAADSEVNARAYAFYLLAREGSVDAAQLRRFHAVRFAHLTSPLAKAQVAAALARVGDVEPAKDAFARAKSAIVYPTKERPEAGYRYDDYGTALRDEAGLLALMAESGVFGWPDVDRQARALSARLSQAKYLSTQEQGWILRAGREMAKAPFATMTVMIDDKPPEAEVVPAGGPITFTAENRQAATILPKLTNAGPNEIFSAISYGGFPKVPGAAEASGFEIKRSVFTRSGEAADLANLPQNEVVVVVLEGRKLKNFVSRALVVDFLPAGLEPENPAVGGAEAADLGWLKDLTAVETVELRDDRFLASFDLGRGDSKRFRVAYLARATTPGAYAYGGALVEDMYAPQDFARTAPAQVNIRAARPEE
ncbi:MG2 domain-containing protein [Neomegalonema perideroedes]|uniref:MG2 domain-containing protein n=1 Tax=Neomegalonema perideroedes TaxID=217219 RepID=UPI0003660D55|nr:MG2 domain-containing protein [Neomegalonema perideroedes]